MFDRLTTFGFPSALVAPAPFSAVVASGATGSGVAGALGGLGLAAFGWGLETLFVLMACGLVVYGLVMAAVMRRELGLVAVRGERI